MSEQTGTVRQRMIELLKIKPWDTGGLSRALGVSQRQVETHLEHVFRSSKNQGQKLIISPPQCSDCDFVFKDRTRTTKPSRCPQCRKEQVIPPLFFLEN